VQSLCRENDDEMRWLIALISDTGMRLGEAAGLLKEDIKLDDRIPLSNSTPIAKPIRTSNPVQRITKVVKVYE
jgi:integrase